MLLIHDHRHSAMMTMNSIIATRRLARLLARVTSETRDARLLALAATAL